MLDSKKPKLASILEEATWARIKQNLETSFARYITSTHFTLAMYNECKPLIEMIIKATYVFHHDTILLLLERIYLKLLYVDECQRPDLYHSVHLFQTPLIFSLGIFETLIVCTLGLFSAWTVLPNSITYSRLWRPGTYHCYTFHGDVMIVSSDIGVKSTISLSFSSEHYYLSNKQFICGYEIFCKFSWHTMFVAHIFEKAVIKLE